MCPNRPRSLTAAAAAAALAVATAAAPAVGATGTTAVHCGQTLTSSVRLANDLSGCPDEGLIIGADNITIDLNGHTVAGDGQPVADCAPDAFCDIGLDNTAGHTGVTLK